MTTLTADEINDVIRAQVDRELPKPRGGFETDEQETDWREAQENRFFELCRETRIKLTPELEAAFAEFKESDQLNIVANSINDLCEAEMRRIHACSNSSDSAAILAEVLRKPSPVKVFDFDQENALEIFADRSLYERSSADSTVWAEAGDFYLNRLEEPVTAGLRAFFNVSDPEDADQFRITVRRFWSGPLTTEDFAQDDRSDVAVFTNREAAQQWITDHQAGEYRLSHNESGCPEYIITPCV